MPGQMVLQYQAREALLLYRSDTVSDRYATDIQDADRYAIDSQDGYSAIGGVWGRGREEGGGSEAEGGEGALLMPDSGLMQIKGHTSHTSSTPHPHHTQTHGSIDDLVTNSERGERSGYVRGGEGAAESGTSQGGVGVALHGGGRGGGREREGAELTLTGLDCSLALTPAGWHVISSVIPGGACDRSGVEPGSILEAIDGRALRGLSAAQIKELSRGAVGTTAKLTITSVAALLHNPDDHTTPQPNNLGPNTETHLGHNGVNDSKHPGPFSALLDCTRRTTGTRLSDFAFDASDLCSSFKPPGRGYDLASPRLACLECVLVLDCALLLECVLECVLLLGTTKRHQGWLRLKGVRGPEACTR